MKKKILILANHDVGLYNFRKELLQKLLFDGHEVFISCPLGNNINKLKKIGCKYIKTEINRHGTNPATDIKLIYHYKRIMDNIKPDIIFGYTVKPNIYGAIAARRREIPFVANITGLGTAVENPGTLQKIIIKMYMYAFSKVQTVFFQNEANKLFFINNSIALGKHKMLPGSGVNLEEFYLQSYPSTKDTIEFVFISRIMKEKGIEEYLKAAKHITARYPHTRFHIAGFCEEEYEDILQSYHDKKIIKYHGMISDVREMLKKTHCTIHPTYYPEGLSNVLLESAASGRPIITTNRTGTKEVVDDGYNGYLIQEKEVNKLISKIEAFINIPHIEKEEMGKLGRLKVEKKYDRNLIINSYLRELELLSVDSKDRKV